MHDVTYEQPERFSRAIHAMCGQDCKWPGCGCNVSDIQKAIIEWEQYPLRDPTND